MLKIYIRGKESKKSWYLDNGCSRHMKGEKSMFITLTMKEGRTMEFGGNQTAKSLVYELLVEGEKNHKKGGLNCVFGNFFLNVLDNCPQVQSLKLFRV